MILPGTIMPPRRTSSPPPPAPALTPDQMRRRIERLQTCIQELDAFDPQTVQKRYDIPEVIAMETSITDALSAAFGHGTPQFNLYKPAADLDQGPHIARLEPAFGRGPTIDYDAQDAHEARQYLAAGKVRSIQLLRRAIETLEHEIADREPTQASPVASPLPGKHVFVVHGRDDTAKNEVALFLRAIGLEPIILHLRPNGGRHLLTKFREESDGATFAVVLMTPDDEGGLAGVAERQPRARQNVVFELGFFIGKLGPANVAALLKGDVEKPSDFDGIAYITLDPGGQWKTILARELHHAKVPFDPAKAFTA
jgi:predicted nucleotide-binding protein